MLADSNTWMIYGANGYTGRLIAGRAVAAGQKPILAGRDAPKIEAIAKDLDCSFRVFSLSSAEVTSKHLDGVSAVLHCAGPFSRTAEPMIGACLLAGVDYPPRDCVGPTTFARRFWTIECSTRAHGRGWVWFENTRQSFSA